MRSWHDQNNQILISMRGFLLSLLIIGVIASTFWVFPVSAEETTKTVTDMAGRTVEIPANIEHVITLGSVPVLNSFIIALGKGDTISNNLPESFTKQGRWKYQYVFVPQLADEPPIQVTSNQPNIEQIIDLKPDVCFTMDKATVELFKDSGIPVIYLSWVDDTDVNGLMTLLGEVFGEEEQAAAYLQYFDETVTKVKTIADTIPDSERKKVLYLNYQSLSVPHKIADWWISTAGGISVSSEPRSTESLEVGPEIVNAWNPDVIIVASQSDIDGLRNDERFAHVTAVKEGAIYNGPFGAHIWANRGIELPLMTIWTAKTIYPEKFSGIDLEQEMTDFYRQFFGYSLTSDQIAEILSGNAQV